MDLSRLQYKKDPHSWINFTALPNPEPQIRITDERVVIGDHPINLIITDDGVIHSLPY